MLERPASGNNQGVVIKIVSIANALVFLLVSCVREITSNFNDRGICMCPEISVLALSGCYLFFRKIHS